MRTSTLRNLPPQWKDEADAMSTEQLKAAVVTASANLQQVERAAEQDEAFQDLKTKAKDAGAGYADARKAMRAQIDYALHRLQEKGVLDLDASADSLRETLEKMRGDGLSVSVSIGGVKVGEMGAK